MFTKVSETIHFSQNYVKREERSRGNEEHAVLLLVSLSSEEEPY